MRRRDTDDAANGPKAYLSFTDSNGKQWKGSYVGVEVEFPNAPQGVEVISRSTFGSLERAIAHLLEHYKGKLPLQWAPLQLRLLLPGERLSAYASQVKEQAQQAGIRVDTDATMRKLGAKVHQAELENIPYIAVIGEREEKQQTICVRASTLNTQTDKKT
jgi:threonyl-tRNA synthetase